MKKILILISAIAFAFALSACSKKKGCMDKNSISYDKEAEEDDGSCIYAGTGGSTTIVAKVAHHGKPVFGQPGYPDSAFIKFNTENYPGNTASAYDLVIAGEEGEDHVHIPGMKPGKYYIWVTGYDTAYAKRVTGGIPYTFTQASGEVDVTVPVDEVH